VSAPFFIPGWRNHGGKEMADQEGLQGDTSAVVDEAQTATVTSAPAEPKYVTIEEAQRLADAAAEKAFTRAQSLVDKSSNRINEQISARVQQIEDAYKMTGQEMTPEQRATLRQNVVMQTLSEKPVADPQQVSAQKQPAQADSTQTPGIDPIAAAAIKMAEAVGGFDEKDPEYKEVSRNDLPAHEWLAKVAEQVQAKRERLASVKSRNPGSTIVGMSSGGNVSQNDISNITDPAELYALGEKRLRKR
jgi:hypothetical protein